MTAWVPYSSWIEATGTVARLDVPIPSMGQRSFFRLQIGATNSPAGLAPNLTVSAQRLPSGMVQLQWPSSIGWAYRVLGSTNFTMWTPVSEWLKATSSKTVFPLPLAVAGSSQFYRVEVTP
jgi:hypothetical protein